jgi:hypothetical protein
MAIRVTRTIAEVAGLAPSSVRVTRTMAEVAGQAQQTDLRLYRIAVMVLASFDAGTSVSSSDTLTFSQSELLSRPVSASDTITFSESATKVTTLQPEISDTITFTQTIVELPSISPAASDTLTFTEDAQSSQKTVSAVGTVTFSPIAASVGTILASLSDTVTFSQLLGYLGPVDASDTLTFTQASGGGHIIPGGIVVSANTQTVTFSQTPQKVLIKVGAVGVDGEDTVTFTSKSSLPRFLSIPQSFILTQVASGSYVWVLDDTVTFSFTESIAGSVRSRTIAQTLSFSHAIAYENRIDLCGYSPSIGASTDPNAPAPPPATLTMVKQNSITLSYPTVAPTVSVSIRAPEFGDQRRLNFDRVNRESRGGSLQIFTDPTWPKQEILEVQFTALKEAEAQAVLDFFTTTLGQEVKLVDWYGRVWHGFVVSPEASPLTRSRRNIVDLSFEFEGEQQ